MHQLFKTLIALLVAALIIAPCSAFASETMGSSTQSTSIEIIGGGYYIKHETMTATTKNRSVQTYNKVSSVYNSSNVLQCTLQLLATFDYGNGSVRCTKAWTVKQIYNDSWSIEDVKCTYTSGASTKASANASFRFVKRFLGIVINNKADSLLLTCDKNGIPG